MKTTICGRTEQETKEQIAAECALRGHSLSEAVDIILTLGLPSYLKKFQAKYQAVEKQRKASAPQTA